MKVCDRFGTMLGERV